MLKKTLHNAQWGALLMLFVGVAIVQLQNGKLPSKTPQTSSDENIRKQYPMMGLMAVIASTLCSGFAGKENSLHP